MKSSYPILGFRKRVLKNFSALIVIRGIGLITPIVSLPYIIRVVGIENYGLIAFSTIVSAFAGSIIQYGFSISAVKYIAIRKNSLRKLTSTFWHYFYASLLIALLVGLVHSLITISLPEFREMWLIHSGAMLAAIGTAIFPHWLFLGVEKSFIVAISTLFVRISHLILILIFVRDPDDFVLVNFLGALAAWLNISVAVWLIVFRLDIRPIPVRLHSVLRVIRLTFPAFLLQWAPNMYNSASMIILGVYVSPAAIGGFNAANTLVTTISAIGQLLANALLPILSTSFDRHRVSAFIIIIMGAVASLFLYIFAPGLAVILSNVEMELIQRNIRLLSISIPFLFVYLAFGHIYIALTDMRIVAGKLTVAISTMGLLFACILIPIYGLIGFVAVVACARCSMALMAFILYKKHVARNR